MHEAARYQGCSQVCGKHKMIPVFRVQDIEGRGPYRPGTSHRWTDDDHYRNLPFYTEFGWSVGSISKRWRDGETGGCAFRSLDGLYRWFSPAECEKLDALRYMVVRMNVDRIIRESNTQVVFARTKPLWKDRFILPWRYKSSDINDVRRCVEGIK